MNHSAIKNRRRREEKIWTDFGIIHCAWVHMHIEIRIHNLIFLVCGIQDIRKSAGKRGRWMCGSGGGGRRKV
jgi:hypothetical protein